MALTTLARVKSYLGITSTTYDTTLSNLILAIDNAIELYCNRMFSKDNYSFLYTGEERVRMSPATANNDQIWGDENGYSFNYPYIPVKNSEIILANYPVNNILYSAYGSQKLIKIEYAGTGSSSVNLNAAKVISLNENLTATEITIDDTKTVNDIISEITAIANWIATLQDDDYGAYPSRVLLEAYSGPDDEVYMSGPVMPFKVISISEARYASDRRFSQSSTVLVIYSGGYDDADLPPALSEIATKAVADAFRSINKEADLKKEKIGDYSYEKFASVGYSYIGPYEAQLDLFRRVPLGV